MTSSRPLAHCLRCINLFVWISIFIFFCISASALFSTCTIRRSTATSNTTSYAAGIIRCFLTAETTSSLSSQESSSDMKIKENPTTLTKQEQERDIMALSRSRTRVGRRRRRRKLMRTGTGPGSSPPRCTSKCGRCKPCKPVHVPVPPGTPVTTEYYPEAWRCKCGNRLFIP